MPEIATAVISIVDFLFSICFYVNHFFRTVFFSLTNWILLIILVLCFFLSLLFTLNQCIEEFHTRRCNEEKSDWFSSRFTQTRSTRFDCKDVYFTTDTKRFVVVPFFLRANGAVAWTHGQHWKLHSILYVRDDNCSWCAPFPSTPAACYP